MFTYFRLRKARRIFKQGFSLLQKKSSLLSPTEAHHFESKLRSLDAALFRGDVPASHALAQEVELWTKNHFPKKPHQFFLEFVGALVFALVVAFVLREAWFELYEVPTGSMRPAIEELDRLVVSKSTFGIHLPGKSSFSSTNLNASSAQA